MAADIVTADFVKSSSTISQCPEPDLPEYAFIGRSNVGKSSLINTLTKKKKLAKISGTPGKTQLVNHFKINEKGRPWLLADLPGYGYAKVSKKDRATFDKMIREYLKNRPNLMCALVLLDSRHTPQKIDLEFMEWLGKNGIPFVMVFTKLDKLSSSEKSTNLKKYQTEMLKVWETLPQLFHTSSSTGVGRQELIDFIEKTNDFWEGYDED
ncbi:MAG: ribosome biogenesis GTP-binding protein YihA/YsxC [Flavobacteriales bacterium]|nr:ribosome biogenesis GTP-binding protein YihA/YsxC [Flavobacteriales bacterium]MDG1781573.1 ribosome biogenesis GTP-binding protein YihA/YsxC [Flavobacteriales bacterium]MDG2246353.1 ribosome biogenesis GTP-binding protein YihA/YsxC [Flavobacteriales bacterium]